METYQTEEEQIAAIKKFVGDNGSKVLAVVVIAIAGILGFQGFQSKQLAAKESASVYYNTMTEQTAQLAPGVAELSAEQQLKLDSAYDQLINEYASSVYAVYANLLQAKLAVNKKDLVAAKNYLNWIVEAQFSAEHTALAELRLAQVLAAQGELDAALSIAQKHSAPFAKQYMQLEGDILQAQGQTDAALMAYEKAQAANEGAQADQILDLKVQGLSSADAEKLSPIVE